MPTQNYDGRHGSDARQTTKDQITKRNAVESRLLLLPAEVRIKIYKYVLHNPAVVIRPCTGCTTSKGKERAYHVLPLHASACHAGCTINQEADNYLPRHDWLVLRLNCFLGPDLFGYLSPHHHERYRVSLLETCRQIYAEAALLPFENTFIVMEADDERFDPRVMFRWARDLQAQQAASIKNIIWLTPNAECITIRLVPHLEKFGVLDNLTIFLRTQHLTDACYGLFFHPYRLLLFRSGCSTSLDECVPIALTQANLSETIWRCLNAMRFRVSLMEAMITGMSFCPANAEFDFCCAATSWMQAYVEGKVSGTGTVLSFRDALCEVLRVATFDKRCIDQLFDDLLYMAQVSIEETLFAATVGRY